MVWNIGWKTEPLDGIKWLPEWFYFGCFVKNTHPCIVIGNLSGYRMNFARTAFKVEGVGKLPSYQFWSIGKHFQETRIGRKGPSFFHLIMNIDEPSGIIQGEPCDARTGSRRFWTRFFTARNIVVTDVKFWAETCNNIQISLCIEISSTDRMRPSSTKLFGPNEIAISIKNH